MAALVPRVRRALLYLQGFDARKIAKASSHPTLDCACLDMEDGVAFSKKAEARDGIVKALASVDFGRTERLVRINAFDSGDLAHRDLEAVVSSKTLPDGIVIPKTESAEDVKIVSERLDALGDVAHDVRIVGMIESAQAMLRMDEICLASPHRLDCVIFGADDYASDVGAIRTKTGDEMEFARNFMLLQASARNISSIDMVQIDYKDQEQLCRESRRSFQQGFAGKQIIHPLQIDPVQESYSPSSDTIQRAAAIVNAHERHQQEGKGAFVFEGKMIDRPLVRQSENLLARARQMGLLSGD